MAQSLMAGMRLKYFIKEKDPDHVISWRDFLKFFSIAVRRYPKKGSPNDKLISFFMWANLTFVSLFCTEISHSDVWAGYLHLLVKCMRVWAMKNMSYSYFGKKDDATVNSSYKLIVGIHLKLINTHFIPIYNKCGLCLR